MISGHSNAAFHQGYHGGSLDDLINRLQAPIDEQIAELDELEKDDQASARTAAQGLTTLLAQLEPMLEQLKNLKTEMEVATRDRPIGESSRALVLSGVAAATAVLAWLSLGTVFRAQLAGEDGLARTATDGFAGLLVYVFLAIGLYQHERLRSIARVIARRPAEYVALSGTTTIINAAAVAGIADTRLSAAVSLFSVALAIGGFLGAKSTLRVHSETALDICRALLTAVSASGRSLATEIERLTQLSLGNTELARERARVRAERSALLAELLEAHTLGQLVRARHGEQRRTSGGRNGGR